MKDKDIESNSRRSISEEEEKAHVVKIQNTVSEKYVREKYVDKKVMNRKKQEIFGNKKTVKSAYGDEIIHREHEKAKNKYKSNATLHQAELDHTVAAKSVHNFAKVLPGINDTDVVEAIAHNDNLQMIDKKLNRSLQDQNKTAYALKSNKSLKDKAKMIATDVDAQIKVKGELVGKSLVRSSKTPMSVNLAKVMQGEATVSEAVMGTVKDTVKTEVTGIAINRGVQLTQSSLDKAQKQMVKKVGEKAVAKVCTESVAKGLRVVSQNMNAIATVAIYAGDAVIKFAKGEITCEEMFVQLEQTSINLVCSTAGAAVGGTIGATIGGIVGSFVLPGAGTDVGILVGDFLGNVIGGAIGYVLGSHICKQVKMLMHTTENVEEYNRLRDMYLDYASQVEQSRKELEIYLDYVHDEQQMNIRNGFKKMRECILNDNAEGIDEAIKFVCAQFNIETEYKSFDDFKNKIADKNYTFKIGG